MLARRSGDPWLPRRALPARLEGHRRVVFRGTPYPTLRPAPGGSVAGLLVRPAAGAMHRLRAYEGACYRLHPFRVLTRHGPRHARAFVVPRHLAGVEPW
ncbi:gamma-glutamylcyclotransferase [Roseomonas gilardii subsp. gilardii]|uniref:gamma-glutamylcyclotransferase family protein n=1 Tax=Roseomonas gilardii TaxID=257708 RepID=UPI001FFB0E80|nr:gamma-glutamylcyclotransferase family protein [Roseomonas gilardii]UPG70987.1 gamma-glutamylcyclotransferase [Roseomonas gilardii subsp. gilardii]